ncbi:hypothetical protein GCK72_001464 [Caenorhabditis remanei]|uniref:Uncharacterized protein n=1 Tax=Caenorhabditis remanei TaxID=31234 RepID=A0A6A5HTH2_CAERE|nr:hypothetical protein GCK72_001464 [Caenorhabditis remanei]KAF1769647.1 hypothetical protein GCK72_001464 [Caenorhabditis remanei]
MSRRGNDDVLLWTISWELLSLLDLADNIHSFQNLSENNVASIKPWGLDSGDEELGSIGVSSSVGHGQPSGSVVLQLEVLVSELFSVDRTSSGSVSAGEISSLNHEVFDDTVEFASWVSFSLK